MSPGLLHLRGGSLRGPLHFDPDQDDDQVDGEEPQGPERDGLARGAQAAQQHEVVEVRDGVAEGDRVVVAANFLIDAESNLRAALRGLAAAVPAGEERK